MSRRLELTVRRLTWCLCALSVGCTSASTTNTPRTSSEQLLVANAVDQSLDKVNFTSFADCNVFLNEKYLDCVDKNYVIASTRHRLMAAGARLVDSADKSDVVLEIRSGAVGTASANSFVGTPEIVLPGMLSIPEVRFIERKRQEGTAKLGLVAYDPKTNEILGAGGVSVARADDSNWFVAGIGPYQNGSVKQEVQEGTSGAAASVPPRIPRTIAFSSPPTQLDEQIAAEPQTIPDVSPAGHDAPQPGWADRFGDVLRR